jgi:hypothetical protein
MNKGLWTIIYYDKSDNICAVEYYNDDEILNITGDKTKAVRHTIQQYIT